MAQEKKFFDRTRETATRLSSKFLPNFKKAQLRKWIQQNQFTAAKLVVLIILSLIVLCGLFGNPIAAKMFNTIFRISIIFVTITIMKKLKSMREALTCILLIISIAVGLNYLGLANPNWLTRIWEWIKNPDFIGLYKSLVNWIWDEFPELITW